MEKSDKKRKEKKPREKLGSIFKNNLMMIGKIARMTPQYIFCLALMTLVWGIGNATYGYFTLAVFNEIDTPSPSFVKLLIFIGLMLLWTLFQNGSSAWFYEYYEQIVDKKLQYKMHSELFDKALSLDLACYDDPKFYNDYVFAMDESKNRAVGVMHDMGTVVRQLITGSAYIVLLSSIDTTVAVLIFGCSAMSVLLQNIINKIYYKRSDETKPYHRKNSYINRVFHLADYAKEIRISHAAKNLQSTYKESVDNIIDADIRAGKKSLIYRVLDDFLTQCATLLPVLILLYGLYNGNVKLGGFVASVSLFWSVRWTIYEIMETLTKFPDHSRYIERYNRFMSYEPKVVSGDIPVKKMDTIEFKNVSFAYANSEDTKAKNSLDSVNLKIKSGEKVAIVGYNGAGKTTLTKLIMRLYDPTEGEILYNGKDLKEYDTDSLRSHIGAVFQDYKIFASTVAENVMGGEAKEEDRERVLDALAKSTFADRLQELPDKENTQLTKEFYEDGVNLSGGEAQKVAIARIFARPYDLIIMDEPSSALDPEAEYELNHTLMKYAEDKTVIFISHRLSTTRMADRILMFEQGRIIEEGSHESLMAREGKYAEMFDLQAEKYRQS